MSSIAWLGHGFKRKSNRNPELLRRLLEFSTNPPICAGRGTWLTKVPDDSRDTSGRLIFSRLAVFLQLIVQCFQAHSQDLGSARLVLSGRLERSENQHPLRFIHRSSYAHRYNTCIVHTRGNCGLCAAKRSSKMRNVERSAIRAFRIKTPSASRLL